MKIFSSKKRVAAIGVVTAATMVGGGIAVAYWTTSGDGTGSASTATGALEYDVAISAPLSPVVPLAPGEGLQTVNVTVRNQESGVRRVTDVIVSVADDAGVPWSIPASGSNEGCSYMDFSLNGGDPGDPVDLVATELDLAGGAMSAVMPVTIELVNREGNQNDCKALAGLTAVPLFAEAS